MKTSEPNVPSIDELTPQIKKLYLEADGKQKKMFRTLYTALWKHVWKNLSDDPLIHFYALEKALKTINSPYTLIDCMHFIKLYYLTCEGTIAVDTRKLNLVRNEQMRYTKMKTDGMLRRHICDPLNPKNRAMQKTFITITPKGIKHYKDITKAVRKIVMEDIIYMIDDIK